jgi:hypothetical protein
MGSGQSLERHAGDSRPDHRRSPVRCRRICSRSATAARARHRVPLRSLQPRLVSAYNHWRSKLPDGALVSCPSSRAPGRRALARADGIRCTVHWRGLDRGAAACRPSDASPHHGAGRSSTWTRRRRCGSRQHERRGPGLAREGSRAIPPRASESCAGTRHERATPAARFSGSAHAADQWASRCRARHAVPDGRPWRGSMPCESGAGLEMRAALLGAHHRARAPIRSPGWMRRMRPDGVRAGRACRNCSQSSRRPAGIPPAMWRCSPSSRIRPSIGCG